VKVLYVEDNEVARQYVQAGLSRSGFSVDLAATGSEGFERAPSGAYDVLILDVMLPDCEGTDLLLRLRRAGVETPVLFLSGRGEVEARVRGLEVGADDYLPKPFALSELVARLRAIVRRRQNVPANGVLSVGDLVLDLGARKVRRGDRDIDLPPKQFALLELLMRNAGCVVSRSTILETVWGDDIDLRSNAVNVQISYLRQRIDRDFEAKLLHTKPGFGYVIEDRTRREALGVR